jgi:alanine racemase
VVGRVSMDLTAFDVTGMAARAGDAITLIGPDNPPDAVAAAAGTIGYEILTALGRRYRREYR